ncbi:MAG: hypothetical protein ACD_56C00003G0004 [uncultured bacterium]|nr:MAG: hypothetical protein ACD_56C00003G0004 [uncultured bacterium]
MFNPERNLQKQERVGERYHFPEIERFEIPLKEIVLQMKSEIENGVYRALLGDDIGGRIPTLILEKIIKEKSSQGNVSMFFVAGGHGMPGRKNFVGSYDDFYFDDSCYVSSEEDEERIRYEMNSDSEKEKINTLKKYLNENIDQYGHGRVLICSEYAHFGNTLIAFGKYLEQISADPFDIMSLGILNKEELQSRFPYSKIFSAGFSSPEGSDGQYLKSLREALGVKKRTSNEEYLPHAEDIMDENEIQQSIIEENRKKLNEDIEKLSKKIICDVWM